MPEKLLETGGNTRDTNTGDFNGDGIIDLAAVDGSAEQVFVFMGNDDGTFADGQNYAVGESANSITSDDFNLDGTTDLAVANGLDDNVSVLLGNGDGTFSSQFAYEVGNGPWEIISSDFDGDGFADLATVNQFDDSVTVLLGNGDGTFGNQLSSFSGATPNGRTRGISAADFNGDGSIDVAVTRTGVGSSRSIAVLLANGDGTFATPDYLGAGEDPIGITTGDFNGDGLIDLAAVNNDSDDVSVLLGNGDGTFANELTFEIPRMRRFVVIATDDFNGDGVADLAVGGRLSSYSVFSILIGNGDGTFSDPQNYSGLRREFTNVQSIETGDFNGDGDTDLCLAGYEGSFFVLGNGDGTFRNYFPVGESPIAITTDDFNEDGLMDLVTANRDTMDVSLLLGIGNGTFEVQPAISVGDEPGDITKGDFNGDGNVDLVTANRSSGYSVLLGNGDGTFADHQTSTVGSSAQAITSGDFNSDGVIDLAIASRSDGVRLYIGNGDGTFEDPQMIYYPGRHHEDVKTGDFNGDGKLDMAVASEDHLSDPPRVAILLGNGDGSFTEHQDYVLPEDPFDLITGDFNAMGRPIWR